MTAHIRPGIRGSVIAASVLAMGLGLAGCAGATTAPHGGDKPSDEPTATVAGCTEAAGIDAVVMAQLAGEPTDDGMLAVAAAYAAAGDALHGGPAEAHDAAHAAADAITQAVEDGAGPAVFEDPAYVQAATALGEFVFEDCDFESLAVTAQDFEFLGLPDEIAAGTAVVQLTNKGENPHVIEISRIPDAATAVEDVIADPGAAMEGGLIEMVAGGAFTEPGTQGYLTVELTPGRYLVTCMMPDSENVPHAMHGMYRELTVA
ncbi:MAG: hypothetical protein J7484_01420 [Microbacterium sp.]|nr:hypothetical protein [Microbacterium sp.]